MENLLFYYILIEFYACKLNSARILRAAELSPSSSVT